MKKNAKSLMPFLFVVMLSCGSTRQSNGAIDNQTILFVCEHGAARSTIAAAYFNKMAKEQGVNYKAVFRGTSPDTVLTLGTKKGLMEDGFDVDTWKPLLVTQWDINRASQIITFDCLLPTKGNLNKPVNQWNGIPAISKDYKIARNEIVEKVKMLILELTNSPLNK
jgi:arsenate reductase (thioredoxin)